MVVVHKPFSTNQFTNSNAVSRGTAGLPSLDTSFDLTMNRAAFESEVVEHFRKQGLEPAVEWQEGAATVHVYAAKPERILKFHTKTVTSDSGETVRVSFRFYSPDRDLSDSLPDQKKGLTQGAQTIRSLRAQLSERYGAHRNWRVSEDFTSKCIVLFYSGSRLQKSEEVAVRQIISQTTALPVRIERRLNQTALTRKILDCKPPEVAASSPAFYDDKFAVVTVAKYSPGTPEYSKIRHWRNVLQKLGRQYGVGIIVRSNGVGNGFSRVLAQKIESQGASLLTDVALVRDVRQHFFPDPPAQAPIISVQRQKKIVELPFVSIDPLGKDNMPYPNDTYRSEADPEDIIWAGRRPDGGYRFVAAIYDVTSLVDISGDMRAHIQRYGQSFYSPFSSYPLLGKDIAFRQGCFQEGKYGDAFIVDIYSGWDGSIESWSVYEGVVKNKAQLSFDHVEKVLHNNATDEYAPVLEVLRDFSLARRIHRRAQSNFPFQQDIPNYNVQHENISGILIEEAMLITKATIGKYLEDKSTGGVHRVYGPPSHTQQRRLTDALRELGITIVEADLLDERKVVSIVLALQELEQNAPEKKRHESRAVMNELFTNLQFGASYSAVPKGHAGLAMSHYAPIKGREGAGVINQFILKSTLANERVPFSDSEISRFARAFSRSENFYTGRLHGLVYLQALEYQLERAQQQSYVGVWSSDTNTYEVPAFDTHVLEVLENYPGLQSEMRALVTPLPTESRPRIMPLHFKGYDLQQRAFIFSPGSEAG